LTHCIFVIVHISKKRQRKKNLILWSPIRRWKESTNFGITLYNVVLI